MRKAPSFTATISHLTRENNSVNGNPRYGVWFRFGSERYLTSSDAAFCYAIGNPGMRAGDTVDVWLTRAGRIEHMAPAATTQASLAYFSVNEDGVAYAESATIEVALKNLEEFPNDHILVCYTDSPFARTLRVLDS